MRHIQAAAQHLAHVDVPDIADLSYNEERTDPVQWLTEHGWVTTAVTAAAELARYGRGVDAGGDIDAPPTLYVSAHRAESSV
jgi:O-methyltransferase involved in polyketide biosynthesis